MSIHTNWKKVQYNHICNLTLNLPDFLTTKRTKLMEIEAFEAKKKTIKSQEWMIAYTNHQLSNFSNQRPVLFLTWELSLHKSKTFLVSIFRHVYLTLFTSQGEESTQ